MEHNTQGKVIDRNLVKELVTCGHGITGKCFWCDFTKEKQRKKSGIERIEAIEDHLIVTMDVLKMLLKEVIRGQGKRGAGFASSAGPVLTKLIDSGADADKPSGSHNLAFWFAEDVDKIYQWRDSSWIDISFSRPDAGEKRVTDIVYKPSTDDVEVTHED